MLFLFTSAPFCNSNWQTSHWPLRAATCKVVSPRYTQQQTVITCTTNWYMYTYSYTCKMMKHTTILKALTFSLNFVEAQISYFYLTIHCSQAIPTDSLYGLAYVQLFFTSQCYNYPVCSSTMWVISREFKNYINCSSAAVCTYTTSKLTVWNSENLSKVNRRCWTVI